VSHSADQAHVWGEHRSRDVRLFEYGGGDRNVDQPQAPHTMGMLSRPSHAQVGLGKDRERNRLHRRNEIDDDRFAERAISRRQGSQALLQRRTPRSGSSGWTGIFASLRSSTRCRSRPTIKVSRARASSVPMPSVLAASSAAGSLELPRLDGASFPLGPGFRFVPPSLAGRLRRRLNAIASSRTCSGARSATDAIAFVALSPAPAVFAACEAEREDSSRESSGVNSSPELFLPPPTLLPAVTGRFRGLRSGALGVVLKA